MAQIAKPITILIADDDDDDRTLARDALAESRLAELTATRNYPRGARV